MLTADQKDHAQLLFAHLLGGLVMAQNGRTPEEASIRSMAKTAVDAVAIFEEAMKP